MYCAAKHLIALTVLALVFSLLAGCDGHGGSKTGKSPPPPQIPMP